MKKASLKKILISKVVCLLACLKYIVPREAMRKSVLLILADEIVTDSAFLKTIREREARSLQKAHFL